MRKLTFTALNSYSINVANTSRIKAEDREFSVEELVQLWLTSEEGIYDIARGENGVAKDFNVISTTFTESSNGSLCAVFVLEYIGEIKNMVGVMYVVTVTDEKFDGDD